MSHSHLFQPITLRGVTAKNRILISPMCQYSAIDGVANDWHLVHLGKFAQGGAGIVMTEAIAVAAEGRITHGDIGLWHDGQIAPLTRIAGFLRDHGAVPAIQLGTCRPQGQHAAAVVRQRGARCAVTAHAATCRGASWRQARSRWTKAG